MKKLIYILAGALAFAMMIVIGIPLLISASIDTGTSCATPSGASQTPSLGDGPAVQQFFKEYPTKVDERKQNAATIIQVGRERKESDNSIEIAIGVGLQESRLLNLNYGDRDSLGVFQQRPSQGWGTPEEILDVRHAATSFYEHLDRLGPIKDALPHVDVGIIVQGPSRAAYLAGWHWDDISAEMVKGSQTQTCAEASGDTHLPLDPGYYVSSGFADLNRPIGTRPHIGVDLVYHGATLGRPVYSAFDGTVVASGIGKGCSSTNDVMIQDKDGFQAGYLHMNGSDITVHVGDKVTAGEQIGKIGACGHVTGPHLHFEIKQATDNEPWTANVKSVQKFGDTWLDPAAVCQHYGLKLLP